jgi:enamine deaminase RidA (YjgF/YER057c/UK114 family)
LLTIVLAMVHAVLATGGLDPADAPPPHPAGARQAAVVTLPDDEKARQARQGWGYADAVLTGDTAYLSGVIAVVQDGEPTPAAAYRRAFDRIGDRLGKIGCSWDDVVEMTTFHTDLDAQLPFMKAAMRSYIRPPFVAWTAVGVTRLAAPGGVTEIKVVAKSCPGRAATR